MVRKNSDSETKEKRIKSKFKVTRVGHLLVDHYSFNASRRSRRNSFRSFEVISQRK